MNTESSQRWRLAAGQTAHIPVTQGSQLAVLAGRVRVEWPADWLGEVAMRHRVDSGEGLACRFERAGWVTVQAVADTEICLHPSEPRPVRAHWTWRKVQP
ncbi:MAG TPA: hypothetical protein VLJ58_13870 [Ramlibacter sp.]|nr:hypothetical protein [Ramlibacter sp.]